VNGLIVVLVISFTTVSVVALGVAAAYFLIAAILQGFSFYSRPRTGHGLTVVATHSHVGGD